MRIELVFDHDCPNAEAAREKLAEALSRVGLPSNWTEWERSDPAAPEYTQRLGSPTILLDGADVSGTPSEVGAEVGASSCRVYRASDGSLSGVPPLDVIVARLSEGRDDR